MNITILVGNGFDISLGLKTDYASFLKQYAIIEEKDSGVIKDFKEAIASDIKNWSDFERKVGEYTACFEPLGSRNRGEFYECMNDIRQKMIRYLEDEERTILSLFEVENGFINNKEAVQLEAYLQVFTRSLFRMTESLSDGSKNKLSTAFNDEDSKTFSFILFNYTRLFERFLRTVRYYPEAEGISFYDPVHVHGSLNQDVLFGVNDVKQVKNQEFCEDSEFVTNYIKPYANNVLENMRMKNSKEYINESDIIVIYGMSLGKTDAIWWNLIGDWLCTKNKKHFVIVFYFDANRNKSKVSDLVEVQSAIRARLLPDTFFKNQSEENIESMRKQVFVELNSNFFMF